MSRISDIVRFVALNGAHYDAGALSSCETSAIPWSQAARAEHEFCAARLAHGGDVAPIASRRKNYYFLYLKETILRLFADGTFLGEWFFATLDYGSRGAKAMRAGRASTEMLMKVA
jgi:hypothetical protein